MSQTIINGDSLEELKRIKPDTIDAVITDPPYGIAFLGKDWDSFRATKVARSQVVKNLGTGMRMTTHTENVNYQQWCEQWGRECLRVLKPGGYLLAFSAARLYHRITAGLEDAGFEIRDQIMWLYASGFPKAQDIGKAMAKRGVTNTWHGWKTALKPAHEPICMARKPFKGSTIDNVQKHGVGALNIDATRIPFEDAKDQKSSNGFDTKYDALDRTGGPTFQKDKPQAGRRTASFSFGDKETHAGGDGSPEFVANDKGRFPSNVLGEVEGYQKFFYCPKVSRRERHRGTDNNHPTVKPVELMKYLIRLVAPEGAHIVDPFSGSGSTGMACKELGNKFTGIDLDRRYCDIARKRIQATATDPRETLFDRT